MQGGQLALSPKYTASLGGSYERLVGSLLLRASLAARYTSRTLTGSDRDPLKTQDAYTIVNARLGVGPADERWTAEVWAQNLFDTDYVQVAYGAPLQTGTINASLGAPRTYGLTLRARF